MAYTEHTLWIHSDHFDAQQAQIGEDNIDFRYSAQEMVDTVELKIKTKDNVEIETFIEHCDAVALRDYLNTIIPMMEKEFKDNNNNNFPEN